MKLAETQRLFWRLATRAPSSASDDAQRLFAGTPDLSAEDRISIYADMFLWRQVDALREDFPKLARVLGDEPFFQLAEAYLRSHPSRHHDLGKLGRDLAAFLVEREDLPRPDLADLAALEFARCEVFEERQVQVASVDLLHALSPEEASRATLRLTTSLRLLTLRHDPVALWKVLDDGAAPPAPQRGQAHVAVWRKELTVFHAALAADEAEAVRLSLRGACLAEICDAFAAHEDPVHRALEAIGSWFFEEWVAQPEEEPQ